MRLSRRSVLAAAAIAVCAAGMVPLGLPGSLIGPPLAEAQNIGQRMVNGTVIDASSKPVFGATVFLKHLKTKQIVSFTSDPTGRFRFTQVDMAEDHELWAEKDGRKSAVKTVSHWDARKDFEAELKLK